MAIGRGAMYRGRSSGSMRVRDDGRSSEGRWLRRAIYWLAVTAVSFALVGLLLQLMHSFDGATVGIVTIA